GAESAMHAGAQDFFRGGDLRIFQLRESERGLHQLHTRPHATGIEHARWIETFLHALAQGARGGILRREDLDRGSHRSRSAYQRGMTAEYGHGTEDRGGIGLICQGHRDPYKTASPVVEHLRRRRNGGGNFVAPAGRYRNAQKPPAPPSHTGTTV